MSTLLFCRKADVACARYGIAVITYKDQMPFQWDPKKADSNEVKHGVTFGFALRVFDDDIHVDVDVSRSDDGETRRKAIGAITGKLYSAVYTLRGPVIWIISARRTNQREDRLYGSLHP